MQQLDKSHSSLLPVVLYASAYGIIHGGAGPTFTLGTILPLVERANMISKREAFIWEKEGKPLEIYTELMTLLQKLDDLKLDPSHPIGCLKKVTPAKNATFRVIQVNGPPCAACGLSFKKMMKCSRCRTENYFVCGAECQRKDWSNHKLVCVKK